MLQKSDLRCRREGRCGYWWHHGEYSL